MHRVSPLFSETNIFSIFQCLLFSLDGANGGILHPVLGLFGLHQHFLLKYAPCLCGWHSVAVNAPNTSEISLASVDRERIETYKRSS